MWEKLLAANGRELIRIRQKDRNIIQKEKLHIVHFKIIFCFFFLQQ